jgi:hypothetical protein
LADIAQREKATLIYEYDFGDGWEHQVAVEKVLPPDSQKTYARCLDGKNNHSHPIGVLAKAQKKVVGMGL